MATSLRNTQTTTNVHMFVIIGRIKKTNRLMYNFQHNMKKTWNEKFVNYFNEARVTPAGVI